MRKSRAVRAAMKASTSSTEDAAGRAIQLTTASRTSGNVATHAKDRHTGRFDVDLDMLPN